MVITMLVLSIVTCRFHPSRFVSLSDTLRRWVESATVILCCVYAAAEHVPFWHLSRCEPSDGNSKYLLSR